LTTMFGLPKLLLLLTELLQSNLHNL
jgi:hypothetical protein